MGRKLACVLLVATLGVSSSASALGLGPIEPGTSLNEPLSARIPLLTASPGEADLIKAELASPEAFERAGVERVFGLTELDFEVLTEAGQTYIHVTTDEPVKEPFLDFLVVVSWPQGRLVREYTVLLNPPLYSPETGGAGLAAAGGNGVAGDVGAPAAVAAAAAPATIPDAAVTDFGTETSPRTYGPVQANETLWGIASRMRPGGPAEINQTMLAILRANPDAFIDGNINALKRGAVLRIPDQEAIASIGAEEATATVRQQIQRWQASRTEAAGGQTDQGGGETAVAETGAEPVTEEVAEGAEVEGQLSVVAPANSTGSDATTSLTAEDLAPTEENIERLQSEVVSLEEHAVSLESANSDLRAQVESLKQELANLQSAMNLQMEQALPALGEEAAGISSADSMAQDDSAIVADEAVTAGTTMAEDAAAEPVEAPEPQAAEPVMAEEAPQQPAMAATEPAPADENLAEPGPEADSAPPEPQPTFIETLLGDTRTLAVAGGVALLLVLLLLVVLRRRRAANEPDDLPDADRAIAATGGAVLAGAGGKDGEDEAVAPTAGAGDALEEADVYLAYGRYDQAQEVLDRALGDDPDNRTLRARLLEVLAKQGDRGGFEAEAQVLHTQLDDESDPLWQQTVALGKEIAPEHPLFSAEADYEGSHAEPAAAPHEREAAGVPAREDDDSDAMAFALTPEESSQADVGDADLAMGAELGSQKSDEASDLQFEVPERSQPPAEAIAAYGDTDADESGGDFALDFSLDDEEATESGAPGTDGSADRSDDSEDSDELGALEFEIPESDIGSEPLPDKRLDNDLSFGDFALDAAADGDEEIEDEVGTKLDLARAYLDMGDSDGARDLLGEVVEEGSEDQKTEAQRLLSNVG